MGLFKSAKDGWAKSKLEVEALQRAQRGEPPIAGGAPVITGDFVADIMSALMFFAKLDPGREITAQYNVFGTHLGLDGEAKQFAMGAAQLGYATRCAEERLSPGAPLGMPAVTALMTELWADNPAEADDFAAFRVAASYALAAPWRGSALDVLRLPSSLPIARIDSRKNGLVLLTNPGAQYSRRPAGIAEPQVLQSWAFGFALRCVRTSLPQIPGRTYTTWFGITG